MVDAGPGLLGMGSGQSMLGGPDCPPVGVPLGWTQFTPLACRKYLRGDLQQGAESVSECCYY